MTGTEQAEGPSDDDIKRNPRKDPRKRRDQG